MASSEEIITKESLHEIIGATIEKSPEEQAPPKAEDAGDSGTKAISNELKSILQLAKEAKLDTNIAHKRKSVEPFKTNERLESSEKGSGEGKGMLNFL